MENSGKGQARSLAESVAGIVGAFCVIFGMVTFVAGVVALAVAGFEQAMTLWMLCVLANVAAGVAAVALGLYGGAR